MGNPCRYLRHSSKYLYPMQFGCKLCLLLVLISELLFFLYLTYPSGCSIKDGQETHWAILLNWYNCLSNVKTCLQRHYCKVKYIYVCINVYVYTHCVYIYLLSSTFPRCCLFIHWNELLITPELSCLKDMQFHVTMKRIALLTWRNYAEDHNLNLNGSFKLK